MAPRSNLHLKQVHGVRRYSIHTTFRKSSGRKIRVRFPISWSFCAQTSKIEFVDMLNEMRFGRLTPSSIAKFRSLSRAIEYDDGLDATELYAPNLPLSSQFLMDTFYRFPRREDVDRSNSTRINRLQTQEEVFTATDGGLITDETQRQKVLANFMAPQKLLLRTDAQVMLIKNVDETLVNGSMGRVVRFVDPAVYGTDLDVAGAAGEYPAGAPIGAGPSVGTAKKAGASANLVKLYPVVEFLGSTGSKKTCLVLPETWKVELPNGDVQVSRVQVGCFFVSSFGMPDRVLV